MFESDDCAYCAAWEHDVGGIYPLTDESRRLRLERISIDEQGSMQGLNKPIRFTPTFIVMFKGHEIGRIEGYRSEDAFWGLLGRLIDELDK
ncbi:MAG: hypothetical protein GKR94_05355 [Gammaproteobacteria bacterium]|nr:hypothetical protein [Gammaproteobacteria bacterium]